MYSNMKSYYFSSCFGYNMLSGRSANAQRLTWMYLKVFKLYFFTQFNVSHSFIFTCNPTSNPEVMSVVIMLFSGC